MVYLACISPLWIPVPSSGGPRYTYYPLHWVLRQFSFDLDVPLVFKVVIPSLPSLDPFLSFQAYSYWSCRSPQVTVPNSQRGAFISSGFYSNRRRIQKSFLDYVDSRKVREVPDPSISFIPSLNKCLALPTPGIMSAAISISIGFMEWHQSKDG